MLSNAITKRVVKRDDQHSWLMASTQVRHAEVLQFEDAQRQLFQLRHLGNSLDILRLHETVGREAVYV